MSWFDLVKIDVQGFEPEVDRGHDGDDRAQPAGRDRRRVLAGRPARAGLDPVGVLAAYAELGLSVRVQVGEDLSEMKPVEVVRTCDQAGRPARSTSS